MSDDRIDALAQRLFQAAREERPDAALQRRVRELGTAARASSEAPPASGSRAATRAGARQLARLRVRPVASWLAAAGALSAAAGLWLLVGERTEGPAGKVLISAETRPPLSEGRRPAEPAVSSVALPGVVPGTTLSEPSAPPRTAAPASPRAALPAPPSPAPPRTAPPASPRTRVTPATPPAALPGASSTSARSVPLAQQLELLKQARVLLRSGQPVEALAALDRYDRELGGTDLKDEAALLRIEALAAQGRAAEAAALARRFVVEHPDSPLSERAQRLGAGAAGAAGLQVAP